jgi:hypothetical protein
VIKNSNFSWFHKEAVAALKGLVRFIYYLFTIPTEGEIFSSLKYPEEWLLGLFSGVKAAET